jgi:hypothetical protein
MALGTTLAQTLATLATASHLACYNLDLIRTR